MKIPDIKKLISKKENMLIIVLVGVLILIIAIPVDSGKKRDSKTENVQNTQEEVKLQNTAENITSITQQYVDHLEQKTEELLSCMEGVGEVRVMITLASSGEYVVEKDIPYTRNTITENDDSGGNRNTAEYSGNETTVYTVNENGDKIPYVIKTIEPVVEGVSVAAQGGGNATVVKNISEVIQALFHIEAHKIKVVKMR